MATATQTQRSSNGSIRTPLGSVARGALAGALGTAAMTAAQTAYYEVQGSEPSTTPAEVAKRIIRGGPPPLDRRGPDRAAQH